MSVRRKVKKRVDSEWDYVSQYDDAHEADAEAFGKYLETHDDSHLALKGEPTRFRIRPLTREEVGRISGIENDGERMAEACRVALRRVSGFIVHREGGEEEAVTVDVPAGGASRELLDKLGHLVTQEVGRAAFYSAFLSESFS